MQVIGTGFGRTGTLSTKRALETLGLGPCYHMREVVRRPRHARIWLAAANGQSPDWVEFLAGWEATVDYPASCFHHQLLGAFPDAVVVHNRRDADAWYESTAATIFPARTVVPGWVRRIVPPVDGFLTMADAVIWDGRFGGRFADRHHTIDVFRAHTEDVIASVPPERLLLYDVADGWKPLCDFLGVPVPDRVFPHVNSRGPMAAAIAVARPTLAVLPWLAGVVAACALLRYSTRSRSGSGMWARTGR